MCGSSALRTEDIITRFCESFYSEMISGVNNIPDQMD